MSFGIRFVNEPCFDIFSSPTVTVISLLSSACRINKPEEYGQERNYHTKFDHLFFRENTIPPDFVEALGH